MRALPAWSRPVSAVGAIVVLGLMVWVIALDPPWRRDPRWLAKLNQGVQVILLFGTLTWASAVQFLNAEPSAPEEFLVAIALSAALSVVVASMLSKREKELFGNVKPTVQPPGHPVL